MTCCGKCGIEHGGPCPRMFDQGHEVRVRHRLFETQFGRAYAWHARDQILVRWDGSVLGELVSTSDLVVV